VARIGVASVVHVEQLRNSQLDCLLFAGLAEDRSADAELLARQAVLRC
jgi:hypothetical protein